MKQDTTNFNIFESKLLVLPKKELLDTKFRKLGSSGLYDGAWDLWTFYSGHGYAYTSRKLLYNLSQPSLNLGSPDKPSRLAQFTSARVVESQVYEIQTLKISESNFDNKRDDEPNTLKQAIRGLDWPNCRKTCWLNMTLFSKWDLKTHSFPRKLTSLH